METHRGSQYCCKYVPGRHEAQLRPGDGVMEVYNLGPFVDGFTERLGELEKLVREPEHLQWFKNLWEFPQSNREEFLELVQHLCPEITAQRWDEAWQWRTVLHENFEQAVLEFVNALFGWY